jgi:hypothetical protein
VRNKELPTHREHLGLRITPTPLAHHPHKEHAMNDQAATIQARISSFFPGTLGIRITSALPDRVTAELDVRDELCTVPGICHGGVLMDLALL